MEISGDFWNWIGRLLIAGVASTVLAVLAVVALAGGILFALNRRRMLGDPQKRHARQRDELLQHQLQTILEFERERTENLSRLPNPPSSEGEVPRT